MNTIWISLMLIGASGNAAMVQPAVDTVQVQPGLTYISMQVGLRAADLGTSVNPNESLAVALRSDRKTRWVEGAVIGTIVGGVGFLLLREAGENHREIRDNTLPRYFVPFVGAAAGFVIGSLIGHGIKK